MKFFKASFLALLFVVLLKTSLFALILSPEHIDFGRVQKYTSKKRYVFIENDSNDNIEILGVVNACGIALKIEKKELLPNESVEGELLFDSGAPQGAFEEKVIVVYKERGEIKEKAINVSWYNYPNMYPEVIIKDRTINLGNIVPNMPYHFEFEIMNAGNMVLTVTSPVQDGFLLSLPVDIMPLERKRVRGTFVADNVGKGKRVLQLETNDLGNPKIDVLVSYNASWENKSKGGFILLESVNKTEDGYELVLRINSKDYNMPVHVVYIEDVDGVKIPIKSKEKQILNNEEQNTFVVKLSEKEYSKFEKSYLYILLGIKH